MENYTDRRRVFMRLPEKDRFESLFEMLNNMAANRAVDVKLWADARSEIDYLKGEIEGISHRKGDTLSTSDKINTELNKRSAGWAWYRDKVLPGTLTAIQTAIFLAIMYVAFGGRP